MVPENSELMKKMERLIEVFKKYKETSILLYIIAVGLTYSFKYK